MTAPSTPPGSEDAGLVLSAEEMSALVGTPAERERALRRALEAARAEERKTIALAISELTVQPAFPTGDYGQGWDTAIEAATQAAMIPAALSADGGEG